MSVAVIGLGGNLGDPRRSMAAALDRLGSRPGLRVEAVAGLYLTPPWGKTDQPAFLNSAATVVTSATARALLDALLAVEAELGRKRAERWGPRLVDLDVLVFGDEEIEEVGLRVPHPRLTERAFALQPLADLMPDYMLAGRPAVAWLQDADRSGMVKLAGPEWYARPVAGSAESVESGADGAQ